MTSHAGNRTYRFRLRMHFSTDSVHATSVKGLNALQIPTHHCRYYTYCPCQFRTSDMTVFRTIWQIRQNRPYIELRSVARGAAGAIFLWHLIRSTFFSWVFSWARRGGGAIFDTKRSLHVAFWARRFSVVWAPRGGNDVIFHAAQRKLWNSQD